MPSDPDALHADQAASTGEETLSARAQRYRDEIERVVRTVGEHPQYELKRAYDFSTLQQRIEFVKDIQSIATSEIDSEKFLVVGADETDRRFVAVANTKDFDESKVRQQLEKYLSPTPKFEVFELRSSDHVPFILFVVGRQPTRRILARVTVDDSSEQRPRVLIREGDLWTKGDSTGKHLARPEDWDSIYADHVEREAEARTRARTDHVVQQAMAQERIRTISGSTFALPVHLTDQEFKLVAEDICVRNDLSRLSLLLERIRDDLIEGWHQPQAYNGSLLHADPRKIPGLRSACQTYRDNVFRPAMQRLILLCLSIVKYRGPVELFDRCLELIRETYEASHKLDALRLSTERNSQSTDLDGHLSHTTVALESLIATYVVGAYLTRRRRFEYLRSLVALQVFKAGLDLDQQKAKYPLAMWPIHLTWGEPASLKYRAGRVDICVGRILQDPTVRGFFGDEEGAQTAVIEFEFVMELNSFLAVDTSRSPETAQFMKENYPATDFSFWPSLIAFDLRYIMGIAGELFSDFESGSAEPLAHVLLHPTEAKLLAGSGREIYLRFLRGLQEQHERLMLELHRFPGYVYWLNNLQEAFKALPREGAGGV
jgi:hypothetical protein